MAAVLQRLLTRASPSSQSLGEQRHKHILDEIFFWYGFQGIAQLPQASTVSHLLP